MKNQSSKRNRLLLISVLVILIVTLTPGDGKIAGNYLDKVAHFIVFFLLSINISYKFYQKEKLIDILFLGILLGLLTEVLQQFIPGRNMDIHDGIADTLGIIIGFYFYRKYSFMVDKILVKLGA